MAKKSKKSNSEEKSIYYHRLNAIANALGVSQRQFGVSIGKSLGYIGSVGDDIALSVAKKILDVYPLVSLKYLMCGEGDVLLSSPEDANYVQENTSLTIYLEKKVLKQESDIRALEKEIGRLSALLENKKDTVHQEENAMDAVVGQ